MACGARCIQRIQRWSAVRGIMNDRVPAQSAGARAHLAYAHENSIVHYPAGCRQGWQPGARVAKKKRTGLGRGALQDFGGAVSGFDSVCL